MSSEQLVSRKAMSTGSRSTSGALAVSQINTHDDFDPCASTASLFLYAQGSSILCLHHDTLAIERRFDRHQEKIQFISVDNVSERGAGRLVVSYDVSQTAIVWDIFTGQEISRFASFEHIRVATWLRNGSVSFGNVKGEVILFEPATSEHVSARTIFDPITALAPGNDCRIYAIGYNNGSILIATIQPFTILHTLTTARGPSSIISLAWHASSTKQKSDMLASQTVEGDLLVWSVSKHPANETPRVIRSLKRSEYGSPGPKWLAWSKNGRIVQYAEGETWAWDVRTKHVTYEPVPTVQGVRGLANYGSTATLFTLGPNHTVQQYDLENPTMVANIQHIPLTSLTGQPAEVKPEKVESGLTTRNLAQYQTNIVERIRSPSPASSGRPTDPNVQELARQRALLASPLSTGSQTASTSSANSYNRGVQGAASLRSRSYNSGTTFSNGSPAPSMPESRSGTSLNYASSVSTSSRRSYARGASRLRHEYVPNNNNGNNNSNSLDKPITELFPYIRSRVNNVPFQPPRPQNDGNQSPDELRRQMLNVVFGWEGDIDELIRDELRRHSPGSQHAILLARWLGEIDTSLILSMMGPGSSQYSDWMLLALTQLGNQGHSKHLGQALVQKLLAKGDIHASAAVLLGMGDCNDAIEVYVSRNLYMEAILLTCLLMPSEWQRQSYLVRKWGEHVVQNSQQHLAIRCFACTDAETSEAWASPTAQMTTILSDQLSRSRGPTPTNIEPSITANAPRPPSRGNLKSPALKLITSFSSHPNGQFKFPGLTSADRTPTNAPGVTPIADSALVDSTSPGGFGSHRLPMGRTGRTGTPNSYAKHRLPSIGETPIDVNPPAFIIPKGLPTPVDSGSDKERDARNAEMASAQRPSVDTPEPILLSSARYTPISETPRKTPTTAVLHGDDGSEGDRPFLAPDELLESLKTQNKNRTKSRERKGDRKAEGLHIQWPPLDVFPQSVPDTIMSYDVIRRSVSQNQHRGATPDNNYSSAMSTSSARSTRSANASARSIDQYISSLDEASYRSGHYRIGRERRNTDTDSGIKGRGKNSSRTHSKESRGRSNQRYIQPAKRSPSSPIPMSPDDIALYTSATNTTDPQSKLSVDQGRRHRSRRRTKSRTRSTSKGGHRLRNRSDSWAGDKSSQVTTRRHSPDPLYKSAATRGRSSQRTEGSGPRSPSSPLPMSPSLGDYNTGQEIENGLRLVNVDRKHRVQSRQSSQIRRPERGTSSRRDPSPDRRRQRERSQSRQSQNRSASARRDTYAGENGSRGHRKHASSIENEMLSTAGFEARHQPTPLQSTAERKRKELAAAELEARRLSLARRPSAPSIPLPGEFSNNSSLRQNAGDSPPNTSSGQRIGGKNLSPANSNNSDSNHSGRGPSSVLVGLPATPRAMRHPKYSTGYADVSAPALPEVPDNIMTLSDAVYRPSGYNISRSASAPPDHLELNGKPHGLVAHPHYQQQIPSSKPAQKFSHHRQTSQDVGQNSYNGNNVNNVSNVSNVNVAPPLLPELRHLQSPPPPPPPPLINTHGHMPSTYDSRSSLVSGVGTINIAIDDPGKMNDMGIQQQPIFSPIGESSGISPAKSNGDNSHRRGRSVNENFTSKIRNFTDRMRSTSRGRNNRPSPSDADAPSPYESLSIQNVIENRI